MDRSLDVAKECLSVCLSALWNLAAAAAAADIAAIVQWHPHIVMIYCSRAQVRLLTQLDRLDVPEHVRLR